MEPENLRFPFSGRQEEIGIFLDGERSDPGILEQWKRWQKAMADGRLTVGKHVRRLSVCAGGPGTGKSRLLNEMLSASVDVLKHRVDAGSFTDPLATLLLTAMEKHSISLKISFGSGSSYTKWESDLLSPDQSLVLRLEHTETVYPTQPGRLSERWATYLERRLQEGKAAIPTLNEFILSSVRRHIQAGLFEDLECNSLIVVYLAIDEFNHLEKSGDLKATLREIVTAVTSAANDIAVCDRHPVFVIPILGGLYEKEITEVINSLTAACLRIRPRFASVAAVESCFDRLEPYKNTWRSLPQLVRYIRYLGGHWRSLEFLDEFLLLEMSKGRTLSFAASDRALWYVEDKIGNLYELVTRLDERDRWNILRDATLRRWVDPTKTPSPNTSTPYSVYDAKGILQLESDSVNMTVAFFSNGAFAEAIS
eukprot:TRINITY_DN888_c0_g2_i1.p1 TRINITY_DN888_c0_g2~~TRINITY_DN888_c0_g2_i1.p1  ORF type:complete len:424 (+),score=44.49 TRINITY_DN888_c0_g2_i1:374-1645(+)